MLYYKYIYERRGIYRVGDRRDLKQAHTGKKEIEVAITEILYDMQMFMLQNAGTIGDLKLVALENRRRERYIDLQISEDVRCNTLLGRCGVYLFSKPCETLQSNLPLSYTPSGILTIFPLCQVW